MQLEKQKTKTLACPCGKHVVSAYAQKTMKPKRLDAAIRNLNACECQEKPE